MRGMSRQNNYKNFYLEIKSHLSKHKPQPKIFALIICYAVKTIPTFEELIVYVKKIT